MPGRTGCGTLDIGMSLDAPAWVRAGWRRPGMKRVCCRRRTPTRLPQCQLSGGHQRGAYVAGWHQAH